MQKNPDKTNKLKGMAGNITGIVTNLLVLGARMNSRVVN